MRLTRSLAAIAGTAVFCLPASALADGHQIVAPGESLTSLAAADGVSITALAGANRLSPDAQLIAGSVLRVPPRGSGIRGARVRHSAAPARPLLRRYVVAPGDTLSALAARLRISTARLAALNGLRPDALLVAGATIRLPGAEQPRAPASRTQAPALSAYTVLAGDTLSGLALRAGVTTARLAALNGLPADAQLVAGSTIGLPARAGAGAAPAVLETRYTVLPGDTLSGLAARCAVSTERLAALNGLPPDALLIIGEVITLPVALGAGAGPPFPTPERVTSTEVEQIAAANGVPGFLAASIAWQESGFNNDLVSRSNARGVMQILPGTWAWINSTLTAGLPLAPASALDNVRAGVLYLRALLDATGGDVRLAIAGYYQGLASVRTNGMYADTVRYVDDVLALRPSFGGP
jgi:LysM repeat protein